MAKLIINGKEFEIEDETAIGPLCQAEGIPFNCNTGVCGSCLVTVLSGAEHLNALTDEERDWGLDENRRLACQCLISGGRVEIES